MTYKDLIFLDNVLGMESVPLSKVDIVLQKYKVFKDWEEMGEKTEKYIFPVQIASVKAKIAKNHPNERLSKRSDMKLIDNSKYDSSIKETKTYEHRVNLITMKDAIVSYKIIVNKKDESIRLVSSKVLTIVNNKTVKGYTQ